MEKTTLEATLTKRATNDFEDLLDQTLLFIKENPILNRVKVDGNKLWEQGYFSRSLLFWEKSNFKEIKENIIKEFEEKELNKILKDNSEETKYKKKYEELQKEFEYYKQNTEVPNEEFENNTEDPREEGIEVINFWDAKVFFSENPFKINGHFQEKANLENLAKFLWLENDENFKVRILWDFRKAGKKTFFERLFSKKNK